MWKTTITTQLGAAVVMALAATAAAAQGAANFPNKPVRLIIPYAAGGAADTIARAFGGGLSKELGQGFVVDHRGGGNALIGTDAVAKAKPDGYTLLVGTSTGLVVVPWTQPTMPYDTLKDLSGISTLVRNDHMIAVPPSLPVANLKELIAYLKANPGKANAYTNGIGTNNHLENLLFMQHTGTRYTVVPYKGGGAAIGDLLAGNLQLMFNSPGLFTPHIRAGKLRGIAISGEKRNAALPDMPTFAEAGLKDFMAGTWYMLLGPSATPREVLEKLNVAVGRTHANAELTGPLTKLGLDPFPNSVANTNAWLRSELERYGKVIRDNNIKPADD